MAQTSYVFLEYIIPFPIYPIMIALGEKMLHLLLYFTLLQQPYLESRTKPWTKTFL